jgi:OmpA-OmpF porin, OOP family
MAAMKACLCCLVAAAASLGVVPAAFAQGQPKEKASISLDQFDPTPSGDIFFGVPSPYALGEIFEPRAKIVVEGASNPLRLVQGEDNEAGAVVSTQTFMHIEASAGIVDRALISVLVPIALQQSGDSPTAEGLEATSPESAQLGDLRIGGRIRLFGEAEEPFQIGVGTYLWVPTGPSGSYVGEGEIRVYPHLSLGGKFELGSNWWWTASAGADIHGSDNPSKIRYGAGIAALLFDDLWQLGPEFYASTPVQDSNNFQITEGRDVPQSSGTNAELLLGTRVRLWHFVAGAAGGPGLTKAIGTPAFRLMASVSYDPLPDKPDPEKVDTDGDDVLDKDDGCPQAFGPRNSDPQRNGCPVLDDDEDGIPNDDDACPDDYGAPNRDPQKNGCVLPTASRTGRRRG